MNEYVMLTYIVMLVCIVVGAFNRAFDASLLQRIALFIISIWLCWRLWLVWEHGWAYPHEPMISSALALYAVATIKKTIWYKHHDKK